MPRQYIKRNPTYWESRKASAQATIVAPVTNNSPVVGAEVLAAEWAGDKPKIHCWLRARLVMGPTFVTTGARLLQAIICILTLVLVLCRFRQKGDIIQCPYQLTW